MAPLIINHMATATDARPTRRVVAGSRFLPPLLARVRAHSLDLQLAHGIEPWRTPVLAARARQLTDERSRRSLAACLEHIVERAEDLPRLTLSAVVEPSRPGVQEARPQLLMLAARLRGGEPINPRGVAALKDVLSDGTSPMYRCGDPEALVRALRRIEWWLDTRPV